MSAQGGGAPEATTCGAFDRLPVRGDKQAIAPATANPLAGEQFYVDTKRSRFGYKGYREPAYRSMQGPNKALMAKIALTPRFSWFGRFSHFDWTEANVKYGRAISRRLGGQHFIINTATNGRGPVHFDRRSGKSTAGS